MREPTFVVGGAQRSGTTTLYHLLNQHPEIYMAGPVRPEPKFFLRAAPTAVDRDEYLRTWFSGVSGERAVGEKSTSYLEDPAAPGRMKQLFPDLRAVFILRHPVERAISNYRFSKKHGLEDATFGVAVREEAERMRTRPFPELSAHPFAYVRRGRYMDDLTPYFHAFRREELLILLNDDLQTDPAGVSRAAYDFLGVDPDFVAPELDRRHNAQDEAAGDGGFMLDDDTLEYLFAQFRDSNARLAEALGRDLAMWNRPTAMIQRLLDA